MVQYPHNKHRSAPGRISSDALSVALLLLAPLLGCTDRQTGPPPTAPVSEPIGQPTGESPRATVKREDLLGFYPNRKPFVLRNTLCNAFAAFRDGSRILCAKGQSVDLWDMTSGKKVFSLEHPDMVLAMALAPDETSLLTVAIGADSPARLWNLETGLEVRAYPSHFSVPDPVSEVAANRQAKRVSSREPNAWATPRGHYLAGTGFGYTAIAFSRSGQTFALGSDDGSVVFLDTDSGRQVGRLAEAPHSSQILNILFSPNETRVLTTNRDAIVRLWDYKSGTLIRDYGKKAEKNSSRIRLPLAFSPDGTRFAYPCLETGTIQICDAETGMTKHQLPKRDQSRRYSSVSFDGCIAFLPGGRLLDDAGCILSIWDVDAGRLTHAHRCRSGVNPGYDAPQVKYVRYLPELDAAMAVEVDNDENTFHEDWTTVSVVPFSQFWDTSAPFRSETCKFSALFPDEPRCVESTVTRNSVTMPHFQHLCRTDNTYFRVITVTHPDAFIPSHRQKDLDAARDRLTLREEFKLDKESETTIDGETARELRFVDASGSKKIHWFFTFHDNREYSIAFVTLHGEFPEQEAEAFIRSFTFIE